jgi:hypothetical protein
MGSFGKLMPGPDDVYRRQPADIICGMDSRVRFYTAFKKYVSKYWRLV